MSNKQNPMNLTVKKGNKLTVPLIISLCANLALVVAVVVMAVSMSGMANSTAPVAETTAPETTAAETAAAETESAQPEIYSFETADGASIEVQSLPDAYILGDFTCAGDDSVWNFVYDEASGTTTVSVTMADGSETANYNLSFYQTTAEESQMVVEIISEDESAQSVWYVSNVLETEESQDVIGMYMVEATTEETGVILYLTSYYEENRDEIQANLSEAQSDTVDDAQTAEETPAAETSAAETTSSEN